MSLKAKPLRTKDLMVTVCAMSDVAERARLRIREEMSRKHLSQRDLAGILEGWSQSRIAKLLTGRVHITLDDLESLCFAVGISPTEAVRDRGLEFCAEMTPTEMRLLEVLRGMPQDRREAFKLILMSQPGTLPPERRGVTPRKKILGKPRRDV